MLLDFQRSYLSMQSFLTLNGEECILCKKSYRVTSPPEVYQQVVGCVSCKWNLTFTKDDYGCHKPSIFSYKQYQFAIDAASNLHIQEVANYQWGVWKKNTTIISFGAILEAMHSGECALECLKIRQKLEAKNKRYVDGIYV
jgi:hypothetical protein